MTSLQAHANQPIRSLYPATTSFTEALYFGSLSTCPNHTRPSMRHLETASTPKSLLKLFKLPNPRSAYSGSPILSHGNHNKGFSPCFLFASSTSWLIHKLISPPPTPKIIGLQCCLVVCGVQNISILLLESQLSFKAIFSLISVWEIKVRLLKRLRLIIYWWETMSSFITLFL